MLTRREMLKMGMLAGGALVLPSERAVRAFTGAGEAAIAPFSVPLRLPPVLRPVRRDSTTDYYDMTTRPAVAEILPGRQTPVWAYGGQFPGPTIRARSGRRVVLRQRNRLRIPITTHLHGGHVASADDGQPTRVILPGRFKDYHYPNLQPAATLWYHDHVHHLTSRNIYMGLAGLYLIADAQEARLGLPAGAYDLPLVIQDRSFTPTGSFAFRDDHFAVVGDTILVNGRPQPFTQVQARRYRLRFVNASHTRSYRLRLEPGEPLVQIASDDGLLAAPHPTAEIELWPAERAEAVVDFSRFPVGSSVVLKNAAGEQSTADVMRFDVVAAAGPDTSRVPSHLRTIPRPPPAQVTRTILLGFDRPHTNWVINGKPFDPRRVDARPRRGVPEVWRIVNRTGMTHPFHFHNQHFRVLDRNGRQPPPGEAGFKDTVAVHPGETVRVLTRFDRYLGRYVYHCHTLPHEDHSMMAQLEVVP